MAARNGLKTFALISLCLALALGGCGRRSSLDRPSVDGASATDPAQTNGGTTTPNDFEPQPDSRPFALDFLI